MIHAIRVIGIIERIIVGLDLLFQYRESAQEIPVIIALAASDADLLQKVPPVVGPRLLLGPGFHLRLQLFPIVVPTALPRNGLFLHVVLIPEVMAVHPELGRQTAVLFLCKPHLPQLFIDPFRRQDTQFLL